MATDDEITDFRVLEHGLFQRMNILVGYHSLTHNFLSMINNLIMPWQAYL